MKDLRLKHLVCQYALFLLLVMRFRLYRKDSVIKIQGTIANNQTAYTIKCCYPAMPIVCQNCLTCATIKLHFAPCIAHNRLWTFVALLLLLFKVSRIFVPYFLPLCFWAFALELDCIVSRFNRFVKPYFVFAFGRCTNNFRKLE